jgi:hypothetical protein
MEVGIVAGVPHKVIAGRFGVGHDSVSRHSRNHLSPTQRAAILAQRAPTDIDLDKLREDEGTGLLANVQRQRARLQQISEVALEYGDTRGAVAAENTIVSNLTLTARLVGQLVQVHDVRHSHVLLSEDYIRVRTAIVAALRPHPAAALAVSRALATLESEGAEAIAAAAAGKRKAEPVLIDVTPNRPEPPTQPGPPPPPPPYVLVDRQSRQLFAQRRRSRQWLR